MISRDVIFDEKTTWKRDNEQAEMPKVIEEPKFIPRTTMTPGSTLSSSSTSTSNGSSLDFDLPPRKVRSLREIYETCDVAFYAREPQKFEEATKEEAWNKAMNEEMTVIEKHHTWKLVHRPKEKDVISLNWIFKIKYNEDDSIQKYKAWFVEKGYSQQQGLDLNKTFSLVAWMETIRIILAL